MAGPVYDPFPKYRQIYEIILRRLRDVKPGERLPTEVALAEECRVSRVTIRHVLRDLTEEGIIVRRPRVGTFLVAAPKMPSDRRLTGPIEDFAALGLVTDARSLDQGPCTASPDVAEALELRAGCRVYAIRRLRILEGEPLLLLEAYFPLELGRALAREDLGGGLFVPVLEDLLGHPPREDYQQVDALVADAEMAGHLSVAPGSPILCVNRLFVGEEGRPVVYFKTNFRADRYYYSVKLPRPAGRRKPRPAAAERAKGTGPA